MVSSGSGVTSDDVVNVKDAEPEAYVPPSVTLPLLSPFVKSTPVVVPALVQYNVVPGFKLVVVMLNVTLPPSVIDVVDGAIE